MSYVVECNDAAWSQQLQAHLVVDVVAHFVSVNERKVKRSGLAPVQQLLYNIIHTIGLRASMAVVLRIEVTKTRRALGRGA